MHQLLRGLMVKSVRSGGGSVPGLFRRAARGPRVEALEATGRKLTSTATPGRSSLSPTRSLIVTRQDGD